MKTFSKRNVNTITIPKNHKVLKIATRSLTIIIENLLLKAIKYCFIPSCGSMVRDI